MKIRLIICLIWMIFLFTLPGYPSDSQLNDDYANYNDCGYSMCQYEKGNIDGIIIERAKNCQTLMFGEVHDNALAGNPPPIEDSLYVISLLPKLKDLKFNYLAVEVSKDSPKNTHSSDIIHFYEAYKNKKEPLREIYPYAKPGWIDLMMVAIDLDFQICFIDVSLKNIKGKSTRDTEMFKNLKNDIFTKDKNAKIIIYIGANHIVENETYGIYTHGKKKTLGLLLSEFTQDKNYSVYMGHTYNNPTGCDLSISNFIWETY